MILSDIFLLFLLPFVQVTIDASPLSFSHDDVMICKRCPHHMPFVTGMHQSPVDSLHKMVSNALFCVSLMSVWTNCWKNTRVAGDLTCNDLGCGSVCPRSEWYMHGQISALSETTRRSHCWQNTSNFYFFASTPRNLVIMSRAIHHNGHFVSKQGRYHAWPHVSPGMSG